MMSSQAMHIDPLFRHKMPLFDGTIASTGLSKPPNMSGFLSKPVLQYNGAYFTYDHRGKDGAGFTPPWSTSKPTLLDGRSPVSHLSGMEGQNHIMYRQESKSLEEGHSPSSSLHHAPVLGSGVPQLLRQWLLENKSWSGEFISPISPSENSVYLAIPKPHYMHNPCCDELGCVIGHQYSVEHGSQRIPSTVYEHDWMQNDAHCTERPPVQRTGPDTLLQQRGLQFEPRAEPLKRGTYSPGRAGTFPAMIDPNYSSYPCTPTRPLYGSLSEQSQRLQTSPRGYPSLYSSHPTYEHMTSEVYQEHSPMSKYGQLTQHPMFYYSQANVEVENRSQCKQREDVPVILKHTISNPREHYIFPQSFHGEIPLSCSEISKISFEYKPNQIPPKRQHAMPSLHSNDIVSQSGQNMAHHMASSTDQHKDKPSPQFDQSHPNSPFRLVNISSPARRVSPPSVSPSNIHMNRFHSPLTSMHMDRPVFSPTGLNMERILDYSSNEAHVRCPEQPKSVPVSPQSSLPRSPHHISNRIQAAVANQGSVRKIIDFPLAPGNQHNGPVSSPGSSILKRCLKRSISHSFSPIKIKKKIKIYVKWDLLQNDRG
ncbi:hypothetical protein F7725_022918 [Dissostichus mawsoni]|uniref:Uncharacterized protein n=1 Tax=Dissostichus mawsoni TaxID=36200 RepID=A0A7J5Z056_DISMA|nr:hypothetical protein F7725_022918 [Dissostichus mawsoni]